MRKFLFLLLSSVTFHLVAQQAGSKAALAKVFIAIPDSCFAPLKKYQPDSLVIDKKFRAALIDTSVGREEWNPALHFVIIDTVRCYLKLLSKSGDPEGMWCEIAYRNKADGTLLVLMSVNYADMCIEEQQYFYCWTFDGKNLTSVNPHEILPDVKVSEVISHAFLKKHKELNNAAIPSMMLLDGEGGTVRLR